MLHRILISLLLLSMVSCRQKQDNNLEKSLQDSAMASYIKVQDSLFESKVDFFGNDTNEPNYVFLKAIYNRDTDYLRQVIAAGQKPNIDTIFNTFWQTSIPNLKTLRCNEAYQFNYSETFCDFTYIITIFRINDSAHLSKRIIKRISNGSDKLAKLTVYEHEEKALSMEDWRSFKMSIDLTDYWNLKSKDNVCVLDPSTLSVKGIKKIAETNLVSDIKSVERQVFRKTALYQSFQQVLKLSSIDKVCDH